MLVMDNKNTLGQRKTKQNSIQFNSIHHVISFVSNAIVNEHAYQVARLLLGQVNKLLLLQETKMLRKIYPSGLKLPSSLSKSITNMCQIPVCRMSVKSKF